MVFGLDDSFLEKDVLYSLIESYFNVSNMAPKVDFLIEVPSNQADHDHFDKLLSTLGSQKFMLLSCIFVLLIMFEENGLLKSSPIRHLRICRFRILQIVCHRRSARR